MANDVLKIVVDDGRRRIPITNQDGEEIGVFYFAPTDIGIIQRLRKMKDDFENITKPLENVNINPDGTTDENDEAQIDALQEAEDRLYKALNGVLNADVAGAFFSNVNPFSPIDGGFYCMRVIDAITDFVNNAFEKESNMRSARVEKYTNKYNRK